jgi:hypothetical protein
MMLGVANGIQEQFGVRGLVIGALCLEGLSHFDQHMFGGVVCIAGTVPG